MAGTSQVELRRVAWSDDLAAFLGAIPPQPHVSPAFYRAELDDDAMVATGVFADGELIGAAIHRFEDGDQGTEMVVVMAAGHLPGVDLVETILPALEGLARDVGCVSVRFHTLRKGLMQKAARLGYVPGELVMRKGL